MSGNSLPVRSPAVHTATRGPIHGPCTGPIKVNW